MVRYKEFRIGDLFDVTTGSLVKTKEISAGDIPRISVRSDNNGILGYYDTANNSDARHAENFISVNFFGNAFYHPYLASLEMKVHCLKLKTRELTESLGLYLTAALNKVFAQRGYSYGEQLSSSDLKNQDLRISLPVTPVVVSDWSALENLLEVHSLAGWGMSKIDTSSWQKFKIKDLFDVKKGKRLTQADMVPGNIRFVGATSANNGETARIGNMEHVHSANTITVTYNGSVGEVFYQDEQFWASDDVNVLYPKFEMTEPVALFLVSVIKKLRDKYSYSQKWVKDALEQDEILLPATEKEVPDWSYMQEYIAELEQEHIAELEQDLIATSLNDYTLTDADLKILSLYGSRGDETGNHLVVPGLCKEMREFKMGALFDAEKGDVDLQQDDVNGKGCYFINSGLSNDGIKGRTDRPAKIFPANTITIDFWGNAFYRDFEYKMATHNHVFSLSGDVIKSREVGLYLVSQMSKFPALFSYNNMGTWPKISALRIVLPIQTDVNGQPVIDQSKKYHPDGFLPDWEYMEAYIRAIEKEVIRDVVDFKDAFIANMKLMINAAVKGRKLQSKSEH